MRSTFQNRSNRLHRRCATPDGFTFVELLLVIVILVTLLSLTISMIGRAKNSANGTVCLVNLRALSQAFALYTVNDGGRYPNPAADNTPWEQSISGYLASGRSDTSSLFKCPADQELFATIGSSYDWRDTGVANTTLAGQNVSQVNRPGAALVFDTLPGWHDPEMVNVAFMDGSSRSINQHDWLKDLATPLR